MRVGDEVVGVGVDEGDFVDVGGEADGAGGEDEDVAGTPEEQAEAGTRTSQPTQVQTKPTKMTANANASADAEDANPIQKSTHDSSAPSSSVQAWNSNSDWAWTQRYQSTPPPSHSPHSPHSTPASDAFHP